MNQEILLEQIIREFEKWYNKDPHKKNISHYDTIMNKNVIENYTDTEFIDFFYNFVDAGGKVQSGGKRTKNSFKLSISTNLSSFRSFVIEPFANNFDIENWFNRVKKYKYFGIGIATIYLNRINRNKYSILNNKTLRALRELKFNIPFNKNFSTYLDVNKVQIQLIKKFPNLENFYKTDALNHFLIGTPKGRQLIIDNIYKEQIEDNYEQEEILDTINDNSDLDEKDKLLSQIEKNQKTKEELIIVNSQQFKRYNYIMALLKKYRNYECQFCSTKIQKANGEYYIEACHIKPKSIGGKDTITNILILCPNCHKLLDYGKREDEIHSKEKYEVKLNGKNFKVTLK